MARTNGSKVETKVERVYTPEEEAQFEVQSARWMVGDVERCINKRLDEAESRLERALEEVRRVRESDWRTLEGKAEAVAHEITWMVPNMGLHYLISETGRLADARRKLAEAEATLAKLTPATENN